MRLARLREGVIPVLLPELSSPREGFAAAPQPDQFAPILDG
jgi:hypothetical protein